MLPGASSNVQESSPSTSNSGGISAATVSPPTENPLGIDGTAADDNGPMEDSTLASLVVETTRAVLSHVMNKPPPSAALNQAVVPAIVPEPMHPNTPVLGSGLATPLALESTLATPNSAVIFPTIYESTTPVLAGPPLNQTTVSTPVNAHYSLGAPSPISEPSGTATVTTGVAYKVRGKARAITSTQSRRDSIDGAPNILLSLGSSGYEVFDPSSQQESTAVLLESDSDISTPLSATPPPGTPTTTSSLEDLIIPSSQQTLEEELVIPAEAMTTPATSSVDYLTTSPVNESSTTSGVSVTTSVPLHFHLALREVPTYNIDKSDCPSWLHESQRLDFVLSVEGGELWKMLITTWFEQERRLGFGLNEALVSGITIIFGAYSNNTSQGAKLSLKNRPWVLGDYFKHHHNPAKGDLVILPQFGDEVQAWWSSLQPGWRYKNHRGADQPNNYSYILAGGKKGVFLLILCLAWWDIIYGRNLNEEKDRRRLAAGATAPTFEDLSDHDIRWFNTVCDLIDVMKLAKAWPVPGEGTSGVTGTASSPSRNKRVAEQGSSTRKRAKKN